MQQQIILEKPEGQLNSKFKNILLVLHGFNNLNDITINAVPVTLKRLPNSFLSSVSFFDPLGKYGASEVSETKQALIKNEDNNIILKYN